MLSIYTIVCLRILLRFQIYRKHGQAASLLTHPIRNILFEWESRRSAHHQPNTPVKFFDYSKSLLFYIDLRTCAIIDQNLPYIQESILDRYAQRNEAFALYEPFPTSELPDDRIPAPGIQHAERRYHQIPSATFNIDDKITSPISDPAFTSTIEFASGYYFSDEADLSGSPPHPEIMQIINDWFPHYVQYITEFCRPPSLGPQAFADFNRETPAPPPPTSERHEEIMTVVRAKLAIKPYRPLHFADALAAETPLNTSASYFSKNDPETRALARFSAPTRYTDRPTTKGYNINVMLNKFRQEFHYIKESRLPFPAGNFDPEIEQELLSVWFAKHPAQLFIRSQISKRAPTEPKKIRPVYSVDDRFLHMEKTIITPALAQLRNPQCCVAHGLETFRGSMQYIDSVAHLFSSFISLDWSQYDQRLPRYVITSFFLDYLPSLLIISHGYMPTVTYPATAPTNPDTFATKMYNVVTFLYVWYLNMTFVSYDGHAYIRQHGGVPSGLLNTQFLDSFGNMYVITDCLLEFGFSQQECLEMLFCVMGDDNLIFLKQNIVRVYQFMIFLESYSKNRHGMIVSILKSVFSCIRTKISFLSYENNYGMPSRPIGKLVAQLAMPERPIPDSRRWIHAARALGLAYANCGQDHTFHLLCNMVYSRFKPTGPVPTHHLMKVFKKWKYQLPEFDIESVEYTFPDFPTLQSIRDLVHLYHGSFSETDKWNFSIFTVPPSDNLPDYVTLKEFILSKEELRQEINELWNGKRTL